MKNDNVASFPNDTIAIVCSIVKDDEGTYSIIPLEVACGKIDDETNEFLCKDNNSTYLPVESYSEFDEEQTEYFCFAKKIAELKAKYGDNLTENGLMVEYLKDIMNARTLAETGEFGLDLHYIPNSDVQKRSNDPLLEMGHRSVSTVSNTTELAVPAQNTSAIYVPGRKIDPTRELLDLEDFIRYMNERLVRNEGTMESLCTTIAMNFLASTPDQVHNILSIGPTGSGKSQTFKTMGEYLDHPIAMCDCNELSAAGYVGKSVDDFLMEIYVAANGNIEKANRAIFVLDEIDKLKRSGLEMKEAAQNALLKVIEGQVYTFEVDKKWGTKATLNTGWMTVVGCGAFSEIFEERKSGGSKKPIGFVTEPIVEKSEVTSTDMMAVVTDKELKEYGFKSEFIPRFQKRYTYRALDEEGLRYALTESKNSALLLTIRTYLEKFNCDVIYDDSFIDAVVAEAVGLQQGGRSLTKTVARAFSGADTAAYIQHFKDQQQGVVKKRTLKLTGDTLSDPKKFEFK